MYKVIYETVDGAGGHCEFDSESEAREFIAETLAMGMGARLLEMTPEQIVNDVATMTKQLGLEGRTYLTGSGNHGTGFWRNELRVDLEELKDGRMDAFRVVENIHDTAGMSFREYHGVDQTRKIPDGAKTEGIIEFCLEIWSCFEDLTAGVDFECQGTDLHAVWAQNAAKEFWENIYGQRVDDLACVEVYNVDASENRPFVAEALRDAKQADKFYPADQYPVSAACDLSDKASVEAAVREIYKDNDETVFVGFEGFAEWFVENETK